MRTYSSHFTIYKEPGEAEAEFAKTSSTKQVMKNILTGRTTGPPILPKDGRGLGYHPDATRPLPTWLSQEDVTYYASKFEKTGLAGGLNYYRNLNLSNSIMQFMRGTYGWEPGKAEGELAEISAERVIKNVLTSRTPGPPILPKEGMGFNPNTSMPLPTWLSQQDLIYYASKFEKTGFTGGLNYYRNLNLF
ncbi:bifunctional epoxide hydrolase 2 [Spatholobus suberectus]|nr:bifunctional epoxide hydrolase 2 [Spatholobus suberectus]